MITPNKYLNLDLSVINVSALIIDKLKKHSLLKYDELLSLVLSALGKNSKEVFPYALNFLFLLNKLSYLPEHDLFQLNETK
jgi:hypothetical protein